MIYNNNMERKTVKFQGFFVDTFSFEEALCYAFKTFGQVITINPEMISIGKKEADFAQVIREAELVIPDGIGIEIGLKILGHKVRRIAGIEFVGKLIKVFADNNKTVALVGAKPHVLEKAVENLRIQIPNLNLVYIQDGYFDDEEKVFNAIKSVKPDLLLTALGTPKQEIFNYHIKEISPQTLAVGVGGSFDVWSGLIRRAPVLWQNLGLEWLYRTLKEPKRFKRIFPALPLFLFGVVRERIFKEVY